MALPVADVELEQPELDWAAMLAAACAGEGISSAYQPIVDLVRGCTVGFEALARFSGFPERDPERWFAAARRHGCDAQLEAAALRSALRARDELPPNCFLTVNVSPDLLLTDPVRAVWHAQGDLGGVVVELTEQTPIRSYLALEGDLTALRAAGGVIAVDDAGAGYAGLRHLLHLRPSVIKLDRALIVDVDRDEAKLALVEMVGTFADRIDAWLLAEGIERVGELDALLSLGVPLGQGYLLAAPAEPWAELDPEVALRIASVGARTNHDTIRDLLDPAPTAADLPQAASLWAAGGSEVVLVDGHARPVAVYAPDMALLGVAERGMRANVDTPVRDALARAMTREAPHRFVPLMCTDNAGRLVGIVRIERLVRALTSAVG